MKKHTGIETISSFQLRKVVKVIKKDECCLFVEILGSSFLIQEDEENITKVWALMAFIKEPRTFKEIFSWYREKFSVQSPQWDKTAAEITGTIEKLKQMGIIEAYLPTPADMNSEIIQRFDREINFFNFFSPLPGKKNYDYLRSLRQSHVVLLNLGLTGINLLQNLMELGVGKITALDSNVVSRMDFNPFTYSRDDIGKKRIRVWEEKLKNSFCGLTFDELNKNEKTFKRYLQKADLVISARDTGTSGFNRVLNRLAMDLRKKVLYVEADFAGGKIGPTVLPSESPCYECAYQRNRSNLDEDYLPYFDLYEDNKQEHNEPDTRTIKIFHKILASHTTIEVMKILTGYLYPETYKGIYLFDFLNNRIEHHPVLRLPFCPVCGEVEATPPVMEYSKELFFEE